MKRTFWMMFNLVVLDQTTKSLAMIFLQGHRFEILGGFLGLTYSINPGIWLNNALDPKFILLIQVLFVFVYLVIIGFMMIYRQYYRKSIWMDLGVAFFLAAAAGNLYLDRFFFGFVRDFLLMPDWIANFADVYSNFFIACLAIEFITYPPSRRFLRWTPPSKWGRDFKFFYRFVRRTMIRRISKRAAHA